MKIHHPNLKFTEQLIFRPETRFIVIHHTAVQDKHTVEDVHQWHLNRGMAGFGYHYFIDKNGEIFEGRPRDTKGAHVNDKIHPYNSVTLGVCFEGDFNTQKMVEQQLEASVMLISVLSLAYGDIQVCKHHYLHNEKSCPGKNFPFQELIKRVHDQKERFKRLYGDPKEVNYSFLLKWERPQYNWQGLKNAPVKK